MEYKSHIWSEEEALRFYNTVLGPMLPDESDFFCVAARKKYMTDEEKKTIKMGDTCMMGKTVIKEYSERVFLSKLHQIDSSLDWFVDLEGNYLPRTCMCFYINVNRTSVPKAVLDFKKELAEYDFEFSMASLKKTSDLQATRKLAGIHNRILKAFQDPRNCDDKWMDVDMDMDKSVGPVEITGFLRGLEKLDGNRSALNEIPVVETQGGYHVLISRDKLRLANREISKMYDGTDIKKHVLTMQRFVDVLRTFCAEKGVEVKEISINQNKMVPLPGTLQNGFRVRMHV